MPQSNPNILVLMSDQHRYTSLGHRDDGDPVQTPALDQLSSSGAYFDNAYCAYPICTPSRICILTGKQAPEAGAWGNGSVILPDKRTFPQTFSDAGYETCLQGKMHLGGNRQFAGFDHRPYGDLTGRTGHQNEPHTGGSSGFNPKEMIIGAGETSIPESLLQEQKVIQESLSFIRETEAREENQPWLLCASFSRPHWPRTAPQRYFEKYWPDNVTEPHRGSEGDVPSHPLTLQLEEDFKSNEVTDEQTLRARAAYFACVEYLDEMLGDFLTLLDRDGFLEDTIVVYLSDHGDMLGDYNLWEKMIWHDLSSRVPFVIQLPQHRSEDVEPSRLSTPVSLIDLYPTLCGLAGVDTPDNLAGEDLSESIRKGIEPERGPVFTDSFRDKSDQGLEYRMVREGKYKYVQFRNAPELFFNLRDDPQEEINLTDSATGEDAEALTRLRNYVNETIDFEDALAQRRRDEQQSKEFRLGTPLGTGNAYHLDDGKVVDADTPLYHPHVLVQEPEVVFDDYSPDDE